MSDDEDPNEELKEQINELYSMCLDGDIQDVYDYNAIWDFKSRFDAGRLFTGPQVEFIERLYEKYCGA
jgi:hypothetical protein